MPHCNIIDQRSDADFQMKSARFGTKSKTGRWVSAAYAGMLLRPKPGTTLAKKSVSLALAAMGIAFGVVNAALRAFFHFLRHGLWLAFLLMAGLLWLFVF